MLKIITYLSARSRLYFIKQTNVELILTRIYFIIETSKESITVSYFCKHTSTD